MALNTHGLFRLAFANMRLHKTRRIIVFWMLVVMPILGVAAGLAGANADLPTPSGIYPVTLADGRTTTIELDCTATSCAFSGLGTSMTLSRTANFSEVTSRWQSAEKVVLAGGRITIRGRYYEATDPEYVQIDRYWIPSTVGSLETNSFFENFKSFLKSRNGSIGGPSSPVTEHSGVLILNWKAPQLFVNLSWNAIQPSDDCLISDSGCAAGSFTKLNIVSTTQSTVSSTTTLIPALTSIPATTTIDLPTTTVESPATTINDDTATTVPETSKTSIETAATSQDSIATTDLVEESDVDSPTLIESPLRNTPVSPSDSAAAIVAAVASISAVIAASAAASSTASMSGPAGGSASGSSQRSGGTGARTSNVGSVDRLAVDSSELPNTTKPTTEVVGTAFTMELLDRTETKKAEKIAKPPRIIRNSRIFSRIFYDTGILNAACMRLQTHPMQQEHESPAEPYLARPSFMVTLIVPAVAAVIASATLDLGSTWTVALVVSLGFVCAWLSALHGLIYALITILLGVLRISSLFQDAGDELTRGLAFDPLTTALFVVACSFTPLLSSTLFQPQSLRSSKLSKFFKLIWSTAVMFVIALKLSQELLSQISSSIQAFWDPRTVAPAAIGALTTAFRFSSEQALRNRKSPRAKSSNDFLEKTEDLRAGEIQQDKSTKKGLLGIALSTLVIGFLAFAYTNEFIVVGVICASFIGISLLHLQLRGGEGDRYGHSLLRFQLHSLPSLSNGAKLIIPTVAAMVIGVVVSVNDINNSMAQWISAGFSLLMFLFELYDVKTTKTIDTLT